MGRKPRIHFPGATYHAMARGVDGRPIYSEDEDRRRFLSSLAAVTEQTGANVIAYCLMGNHFHLAIRVDAVPLSSIMQRLMSSHARYYNPKYERVGHLFQARYNGKLCLDERYLAVVIRYIHENPVRAGLVSHCRDWPWSSWTEACEGGSVLVPDDFDPWEGEDAFEEDLLRYSERPMDDLLAIGARVQQQFEITQDELVSSGRHRRLIAARRAFTHEAIRNGHALKAAGVYLRASKHAMSRYAKNTATTATPDTIY